jgi:hypothetical protein
MYVFLSTPYILHAHSSVSIMYIEVQRKNIQQLIVRTVTHLNVYLYANNNYINSRMLLCAREPGATHKK